jgi:protein-S-isoprenylcysteine O-methyltransferase Ste14
MISLLDMSTNNSGNFKATGATSLLLILESALVLALALYMIALGFTHDKEWAPYLGVIVFAIAGSAGLFALAQGVKNGKRWANSPAILANLIALGVAKYQFEAGLYWLAVPIAAMGLTVVACILLIIKRQFD